MAVYLIRHTAPDVAKGVCYGQADVPLMNTYAAEREEVLRNMPNVEVIYSSPLSRCYTLAKYLGESRHVPVIVDPRLMELSFGSWELKRWDDIDPAVLLPWMDHYEYARCPEGECYNDLVNRVGEFVAMVKETAYETVGVVTHAGVIRAFQVVVHGKTLRESMEFPVVYGGGYSMDFCK